MGRQTRSIVTGGAGFVGSHLVDRLTAEGDVVLVIDDLSTGSAGHVAPPTRLEVLDIAESDLEPIFDGWRPDVVYHLAAQASVPRSMADPHRDWAVNVEGTFRVATAARRSGATRLVFVSSGGAIYGETNGPATEKTVPRPMSYYGIHKLAAEGYVGQSGIGHAVVRPSNIYGQRQAAGLEGAVIASFLEQATLTEQIRIHGDGSQTRDFVHVFDVVDALYRLGTTADLPGTWNVASGKAISVLELASMVEAAVGRPLARVHGPSRIGDVSHSEVSAERIRAIGWRPSTDLATGIAALSDGRSRSGD